MEVGGCKDAGRMKMMGSPFDSEGFNVPLEVPSPHRLLSAHPISTLTVLFWFYVMA